MLAFPKSTEVDIPAVLAMSTPFLQRSVSEFNGLNHYQMCGKSVVFGVMKTMGTCTTIMPNHEISFSQSCLSGPLVLAVSVPGREKS